MNRTQARSPTKALSDRVYSQLTGLRDTEATIIIAGKKGHLVM